MNVIQICSSVVLAAVASAASAQGFQRNALDNLFDGRGSFHMEKMKPSSPAPEIGESRPQPMRPLPVQPSLIRSVPVLAEILVPLSGQADMLLDLQVRRLEQATGFRRDPNHQPQELPADGAAPGSRILVVRGSVGADRLSEMRRVEGVRRVWQAQAFDPSSPNASQLLEQFLAKRQKEILGVPGVSGAMVGVDCPITTPHVHIRPHQPSIVIYTDGKAEAQTVRGELLRRIPDMAGLPYRLDSFGAAGPKAAPATPDAAPDAGETRCWLPEGCTK